MSGVCARGQSEVLRGGGAGAAPEGDHGLGGAPRRDGGLLHGALQQQTGQEVHPGADGRAEQGGGPRLLRGGEGYLPAP